MAVQPNFFRLLQILNNTELSNTTKEINRNALHQFLRGLFDDTVQSRDNLAGRLSVIESAINNINIIISINSHGVDQELPYIPNSSEDFLSPPIIYPTGDESNAVNDLKQTEIDFGATPVSFGSFNILDAEVNSNSKITGQIAYDAPTGKDLDELTMDAIDLKFGQAVDGQFTIYAMPLMGQVAGNFKVNYIVG